MFVFFSLQSSAATVWKAFIMFFHSIMCGSVFFSKTITIIQVDDP